MNNQLEKIIKGGVLILTDLETDDCIAIEMTLQTLISSIIKNYENNISFEKPINVLIVTGEGNLDKTELANSLVHSKLDHILKMVFGGNNKVFDSYINIQIVQGTMTEKDYPVEALTSYSEPESESKTESNYIVKNNACDMINDFLVQNNDTSIIALKPLRDLMKCYQNGLNFSNFKLYAYGSFNIRCLFNDYSKNQVSYLFHSFKEVVLYESFHAIGGNNSIDINSHPGLFELISDGSTKLCEEWNNHIAFNCVLSIKEYSGKINDYYTNHDRKLDKLDEMTYNKLICTTIEKLNRKTKILMNVSKANNKQIVLADHGLIGCLIDPTLYTEKRGSIEFNEHGYTNVVEDPTGNIVLITDVSKDDLVITISKHL
jgi:hypothetical protein